MDGRYLKNPAGDIVTLHGLQKCVSPWIDRMGAIWSDDDYEGAVKYQKEWIEYLNSVGYLAVICYGAEQALDILKKYISEV